MNINNLKNKIKDAKSIVDNDPDFLKGYDGVFQDVFDDSIKFLDEMSVKMDKISIDLDAALKSEDVTKFKIATTIAKEHFKKMKNG